MGRKMRMSIYIEKNEDTNMSYFQIDFFFSVKDNFNEIDYNIRKSIFEE